MFIECRAVDVNDPRDASSNRTRFVGREGCFKAEVAGKDLSGVGWDSCIFVSASDLPRFVPVSNVDAHASVVLGEVDVVEDNSVVGSRVKASQVVKFTDDEGIVKLCDSPLGFSGVGGSIDEEAAPVVGDL